MPRVVGFKEGPSPISVGDEVDWVAIGDLMDLGRGGVTRPRPAGGGSHDLRMVGCHGYRMLARRAGRAGEVIRMRAGRPSGVTLT